MMREESGGGRMNERREMLNGQRTALIRKSPSLGRWMFKEEVEGKDAGRELVVVLSDSNKEGVRVRE